MSPQPDFVDRASLEDFVLSDRQISSKSRMSAFHSRVAALAASDRLLPAAIMVCLVIGFAAAFSIFQAAFRLGELAQIVAPSKSDNETVPLVATRQHLSLRALRYCYDQQERLRMLQPEIKGVNATNSYNALVVDYNSRCSDFFYKDSDLETVKTEIIANHDRLADEARRMMAAISDSTLDLSSVPSESNKTSAR